jgi:hypothetical protein
LNNTRKNDTDAARSAYSGDWWLRTDAAQLKFFGEFFFLSKHFTTIKNFSYAPHPQKGKPFFPKINGFTFTAEFGHFLVTKKKQFFCHKKVTKLYSENKSI